jgi:phosphoglycolate phosphatase
LNILCSWANVKPSECIVVGDTTSDTGMAKAAGAGYMVGVLTGSGTSEQLLADGAHLVLPNVGFLPQLLDAIGVVVAATRSPIGKIKSQAAVEELLVDAAASSSILRV